MLTKFNHPGGFLIPDTLRYLNSVRSSRGVSLTGLEASAFGVRAKHSENKFGKKPIINRPNASPLHGKNR
ncbi:hypothetical protein [Anabaena sp. UHCC 0204]|uniref:hypothetical protein n=1 Tax=Anabaena sp. UHCC 0204 TaxID=2590009 RepID=UPI001446EDD9|nr:hypothetical protein [Anabaena sp. UHCC 0204]